MKLSGRGQRFAWGLTLRAGGWDRLAERAAALQLMRRPLGHLPTGRTSVILWYEDRHLPP
jgi:hypothetical protein